MSHRILFLIDSLGMGGAERGLVLTLRHLDRARVEPEVAILWQPDLLAEELEALGIPVHRLGASRGPRALLAVPRVRRLLERGRFDAIHTALVWGSIVGRLAGRRAAVAVISHVANVDPMGAEATAVPRGVARKAGLVARLDDWTGRRFVDRFVAVTETARRRPIRGPSWDRSRITVVERGQDLDALAAQAAQELDPPIPDLGRPAIVTVGRLAPQKGQRTLIDAMPMVLSEFPDARLLVAGEGDLRPALEAAARALGDRVAFLGVRRDVPALLARADLLVLPSLWEGAANALVEAMAVGAPVVASRIPATEEIVADGGTGVLVEPGDPAALAEGILRILRNPEAARVMAERARETARRFDIHVTTRALEAVYDEVLSPR